MFKLQSPSKYSPFDSVHLSRHFFPAQNSFWIHWFWYILVLLPFFVSLFHISKTFPFEDFFSSRERKKSHLAWDQVNREGGAWGSCQFWSKTAEYSVQCGQVCLQTTHHEMGKCTERVFKQNSLKLNATSHNNGSCYTYTDGFLEHPPSRGSLQYEGPALQKIILGFGVCVHILLILFLWRT